jgi:hypothetical protein
MLLQMMWQQQQQDWQTPLGTPLQEQQQQHWQQSALLPPWQQQQQRVAA